MLSDILLSNFDFDILINLQVLVDNNELFKNMRNNATKVLQAESDNFKGTNFETLQLLTESLLVDQYVFF